MKIPSFLYTRYLEASGISRFIWGKIRNYAIKVFNDPECSLEVHGKILSMPLSHKLPLYLHKFPLYDSLPRRISKFIYFEEGFITCIDVGANIGDSIAAFQLNDSARFLAIEPNPNSIKFLMKNWFDNPNVKILTCACSRYSCEKKYIIQESGGTANLENCNDGIHISTKSLDDIIDENPEFSISNILKIDTDGRDADVIIGAQKIITENLPVVLFECEVFDINRYLNKYLDVLNFFKYVGYDFFLLYDNLGYLVGKFPLNNLRCFLELFSYQSIRTSYYFDILLMKTEKILPFHEEENAYFFTNNNIKVCEN